MHSPRRRVHGAQSFTHTPVTATRQRANGRRDVTTPRGANIAEIIVNRGGLWAREVDHMRGVNQPVQPMEHHNLITDRIEAVANHPTRLPVGIDYEAYIYFRQEGQGMLLGPYGPTSTPWKVAGTLWDFGHDLLPPIWAASPSGWKYHLNASRRGPGGIKDMINGRFTFGPDDNPMIGPVPGSVRAAVSGDHGRRDDRRLALDRRLGDERGAVRRVCQPQLGHGEIEREL